MASFRKARSMSDICLPGTQLRNGVPCISTGIPSLDFIMGGGIPVGSLLLIEEDMLRCYSRVVTKYFLAEGLVSDHALLLASLDEEPETTMKELPSPTVCRDDSPEKVRDEIKIAWRYKQQNTVESSFGKTCTIGHNFDLSKYMSVDSVNEHGVECWRQLTTDTKLTEFINPLYNDLLNAIRKLLNKNEHIPATRSEVRKVARVCVASAASPLWTCGGGGGCGDGGDCAGVCRARDVVKFAYALRRLVRGADAVALLTVPTHLLQNAEAQGRLRHAAHAALQLQTFLGAVPPACADYHGLLHLTKLWAPYGPVPCRDLAFKLRRKKFLIEKLHLPPELQESSEREQDEVTSAAPTCAGLGRKHVDF